MNHVIEQEDLDELYEITQTLESLEITTKRLTARRDKILEKARDKSKDNEKPRKGRRDLRVGDLVQVLDNYKGRRGIKGLVTEVYTAQVLVAPIDGSVPFRKFKENVKLTEH